ncbi:4Fe-4S dicluster domain-containing protein [Immundisolibacter sp.]|uniref:4Fe-4S dicluster domain-containing protein n=1 Tax=Immundisolibacter sp. TaxID=1934948 RepID=UPI003F836B8A
MKFIDLGGLQALLAALQQRGYETIGPVRREGAIVYDRIDTVADLPAGWTDRQAPGRYRLERRTDDALFGYAVGPQSWKRYLFPPRQTLFSVQRTDDGGLVFDPQPIDVPKRAFIGVRACELAALGVQDRVFAGGEHVDAAYAARREAVLLVAVNCAVAADTCFCAAMDTGPAVRGGHDLVLTERIDAAGHRFLVEAGSDVGAQLLASLPGTPARAGERAAARAQTERTAAMQTRGIDATAVPALLMGNLEHPRWDAVAERCLSCANCTLACPTCFCSTDQEVTDLAGAAHRERSWDSCFNVEFSHLGHGSVRGSVKSRYRQWLTHKLATWHDQFGQSGCVGCGRCITWCPVGIDITEEVAAIAADDRRAAP